MGIKDILSQIEIVQKGCGVLLHEYNETRDIANHWVPVAVAMAIIVQKAMLSSTCKNEMIQDGLKSVVEFGG